MSLLLKNKHCLVTGGTQAIGKACAKALLEQGAHVWISGRRDQQQGDMIAKSLGEHCHYIQLCVEQESCWQRFYELFHERKLRLDVLVNNAGIEYPSDANPQQQNPENCSLSDWQKTFNVNVDGVFLGCQYAIKLMKEKGGSIVNIGSRSALVGVPASAAYAASKAAVNNLTRSVALHCANHAYHIRCNIIHPAAIDTPMWDKELGTDQKREQRKNEFAKNIPLQKMGSADDIANAVIYFASEHANFTTGTELIIDGGIMAGSSAAAAADEVST